ncbi:MAG: hypothetical protein F7B17_00535, partial [Desulfurococcales archaeon]|nr:hypothetical protein [Desulfurococcales archaeon]
MGEIGDEIEVLAGDERRDRYRRLALGLRNYVKTIDPEVFASRLRRRIGVNDEIGHCMLDTEGAGELLRRLHFIINRNDSAGTLGNGYFRVLAEKLSFETLAFFMLYLGGGRSSWGERVVKAAACSAIITRLVINMYVNGERAKGRVRSGIFREVKEGVEEGIREAISSLSGRKALVHVKVRGNNVFGEVEVKIPEIGLSRRVNLASWGRG